MDWNDLYDWLPYVEDVEDKERRESAAKMQARLNAGIDPFLTGIKDFAPGGSKNLEAALLGNIREQYKVRGQGVVQDAARRGLLHSGQVDAYSRDLFQQQQKAETGARGTAAQFLLQALQSGGQLGLTKAQAQNAIDQWFMALDQQDKEAVMQLLGRGALAYGLSSGGAAGGGGGLDAWLASLAVAPV